MPSEHETASPAQLFFDITALVRGVLAEAEPELEALGLPDGKALFLLVAVELNPYPAELARWMMLPKPTITFLIKRAEAAEHLSRTPDPDDRRRARLALTRKGRAAARQGQAILDRVFGDRLDTLPVQQRKAFRAAMTAFSA